MNSAQRISGRELLLIFLFWTALATLSSMNWLIDPRGSGMRIVGRGGSIIMAFFEAWVWAALTPAIFWLSGRSTWTRSNWVRIPLLLLIGVLIAVGVYVFLDFARNVWIDVPRRRGGPTVFAPFRGVARFRFVNHLLVYFAVLAVGFARVYFLRDQERARESVTLQAQLAEARLDALRMQINPHFLFNTMHAMSALVERDPAGVRKMIARLSELLRHTIDRHAMDEVPLREELAFLRRYIEIMEIRFQGRLRVEQQIDAATLEARVPNLILQPIVENALEHGAGRAAGEAVVTIASRRDGDRLVLTVRDNGPGLERDASSGVGVGNTRARLTQLYGAAGTLELRKADEGGVLAEISLPFRESSQ